MNNPVQFNFLKPQTNFLLGCKKYNSQAKKKKKKGGRAKK